MAQYSRVLAIECVVPAGPDISFSKLLDLNMLVMKWRQGKDQKRISRAV